MPNTFEWSEVEDPESWDSKVRRAAQQQFLADNHHLISPWMYTPQQYAMRNRALFMREFDRSSRRLAESYKGVTGAVPVIA